MDQGPVLEALAPILPRVPIWWQVAHDDYYAKFDASDQLILGPTHRSLYIQRKALNQMRIDPVIAGYFRPADCRGLEFLEYDGVEADLAILLKKVRGFRGRLFSSNIPTFQQIERRRGVLFNQKALVPLVTGYTMVDGAFDRIILGEEGVSGFEWYVTLWSKASGMLTPNMDPQLVLAPSFRVKIRQPDVAQQQAEKKIGTNVKAPQTGQADKRSSDKSA